MIEIDRKVQQSAATAEESASASEEMTNQALELKEVVEDLVQIVGASKGKSVSPVSRPFSGGQQGRSGPTLHRSN